MACRSLVPSRFRVPGAARSCLCLPTRGVVHGQDSSFDELEGDGLGKLIPRLKGGS